MLKHVPIKDASGVFPSKKLLKNNGDQRQDQIKYKDLVLWVFFSCLALLSPVFALYYR